jgi:hypothetical protein
MVARVRVEVGSACRCAHLGAPSVGVLDRAPIRGLAIDRHRRSPSAGGSVQGTAEASRLIEVGRLEALRIPPSEVARLPIAWNTHRSPCGMEAAARDPRRETPRGGPLGPIEWAGTITGIRLTEVGEGGASGRQG